MSSHLSLSELILVIEELRSGLSAGQTLEAGLTEASERLPHRVGQLTGDLATRLRAGEPLGRALDASSSRVPKVLTAAVAAGIRGNCLDETLAAVAEYAASAEELDDSLRRAMIYPTFVLAASFLVFWWLSLIFVPVLRAFYNDVDSPLPPALLTALETIGSWAPVWGPAVPLLLIVSWIWRSWRSSDENPGLSRWRWIAGVDNVSRDASYSRFSRVLGLLIAARTPLAEALRISGGTSGSRQVRNTCHQAAERIEAGVATQDALRGLGAPSMLHWVLTTGADDARLSAMLVNLSEVYHDSAVSRARNIARLAPAFILLVVGSVPVLLGGLFLFQQFALLLERLARLG